MTLSDEQQTILNELEEIFERNNDFLKYARINLYIEQKEIKKIAIKREIDPETLMVETYYPVIELIDGSEMRLLNNKENRKTGKPLRQAFFDAASVCKKLNRLIELKTSPTEPKGK